MDDIVLYLGIVLRETPVWAYGVLVILVLLGLRRLRTRHRSLLSASIAPGVFLVWSVSSAIGFGVLNGWFLTTALWCLFLAGGLASFRFFGPSPVRWVSGNEFLFAGTPGPLIFYMSVFFARYSLGVWAGFQPQHVTIASAVALAISGFTAGRTSGDFIFLNNLRPRPLDRQSSF